MKTFYTLLTVAITVFCVSCYWDKADQVYPTNPGLCNTDSVTYSGTVAPILQNSCALSGCHNSTASGGVTLTSYAGAKVIATDGRLVGVITHAAGYSPMPKNLPKLDDCTIAKLTKWVNNGAPNN